MNVDVRMGDSGMIPGSSIHIGELTVTDDVVPRCFPSNLTLGESIGDKYDNWDGDIGASSKKQKQKKKHDEKDAA